MSPHSLQFTNTNTLPRSISGIFTVTLAFTLNMPGGSMLKSSFFHRPLPAIYIQITAGWWIYVDISLPTYQWVYKREVVDGEFISLAVATSASLIKIRNPSALVGVV